MKDDDPFGDAFLLAGDNKAALQMAKNPVHHKKGKHIHLAFNLTREEVYKGSLAPAFIPTAENPADLMTKGLKKTLHRKHASFLVADFRNGQLFDMDGSPMELGRVVHVRDALYKSRPPGLGRPSEMADKLDRVATFDFADGLEERPKLSNATLPTIAVAAAGEGAERAVAKRVRDACGSLVKRVALLVGRALMKMILTKQMDTVVEMLSKAMNAGTSALLSERLREALKDAILDSGASQTYVTSRVKLGNSTPGEGFVRVATGKRESIAERGDLGPLKGVQKVNGFARTLVSVMDVAEQVGNVLFTPDAAYVIESYSGAGDTTSMTKIANATPSRLYSFDITALEDHVARFPVQGSAAGVGA